MTVIMRYYFPFTAVAVAIASANAAAFRPRELGNPDVSDCGLDAFVGHTAEALLFCSSILKSGTATSTATRSGTTTTTTTKLITTTLYKSSSRTTTPTPTPTTTPTPSKKSSSTPTPTQPSSTVVSSTPASTPSPVPTSGPGCGIVAYVKTTPAYYFESSGTKNTFAACSALCQADSKCKSFGYGEANCMLFDVTAAANTNYNPMSPYTFYDAACPAELPVRKRQLGISLGGPGGGVAITLDLGGPRQISSACSCLITSGPAETTVTRTATSNVVSTSTVTSVVTRTGVA